jgi:hypothetical protein
MSDITLTFHSFVIASEGIATDDEGDYLDGEVDFDAVIDGSLHEGLVARVKQAAGSSFADPLEIEWPDRLAARFTYSAFRDCVEQYVRRQVSERILGPRRRPDDGLRVDHVRLAVEASCTMPGSLS